MKIPQERLEELVYGGQLGRRFTQDSPILPDVWFEYARRHEPIDLLITPHVEAGPGHTTPGALSVVLRERLNAERSREPTEGYEGMKRESARIAYNQSTVLVRLGFDELIRVALPMSTWWSKMVVATKVFQQIDEEPELAKLRDNPTLIDALLDPGQPPIGTPGKHYMEVDKRQKDAVRALREVFKARGAKLTGDVLWMFRVVGTISHATRECLKEASVTGQTTSKKGKGGRTATTAGEWMPPDMPPEGDDEAAFKHYLKRRQDFLRAVVNAVVDLLEGLGPERSSNGSKYDDMIHSISLNRTAQTTVVRSRVAVKADAASRVFDLHCDDLTWAVVDSGIDATHPAFRIRKAPKDVIRAEEFDPEHPEFYEEDVFKTRVIETYDFTKIELLLNIDETDTRLKKLTDRVEERRAARAAIGDQKQRRKQAAPTAADKDAPDPTEDEDEVEDEVEALKQLKKSLQAGKDVDWELLLPLLRVSHTLKDYRVPVHEHGTHVAGILAGDWGEKVQGICPDLRLYDLRVLNDQGQGSEFNAIAALQFIRYLKGKRSFMGIQGVNLSLAIRHEVANYACGRTPICDECERLIGAGIVVVAAAGNEGYQQYIVPKGGVLDAYRGISITDPGNAEGVITVGSTHRFQPHTYGVSYFSSRGPTGDGRSKPDLVAPGEKIEAPVPGREMGVRMMDGTSMAAPHVSGAAALLMSRHRELAGQPERIKQILCKTATDLGREKYFQGHGMVDILRALQSV